MPESLCAFPALQRRFNRLYDALALIESGCELASEDLWPTLERFHQVASEALEAERREREAEIAVGPFLREGRP